jgi:hypothetical protein
VSRADPCAIAAAPPTRRNATSWRASVESSASKSVAAGAPQFLGEARQSHGLAEPVLHREFQVLADQIAVDVLLVASTMGSQPRGGAGSMRSF